MGPLPSQRPLTGAVVLLNLWKWVMLFARAPRGLAPSRGRESSHSRVLSERPLGALRRAPHGCSPSPSAGSPGPMTQAFTPSGGRRIILLATDKTSEGV